MTWCECGHSNTSHIDETGACRALVSNLLGHTSDCPCTEFRKVVPQ